MKKKLLLIIVSVVCLSPVSGQTKKAAESAPDSDKQVLQALLQEMRQFRMALQRTQVISQRIQVTLERLRLQQAHVDSLTRSLDNVRVRLADLRTVRPRMDEQIKAMEELVNQAVDVNRRGDLETQVKESRARLRLLGSEEEQLRQREMELNSELQSTQAKLNDLDSQLDNMIRDLEAP